MLEFFEAIFGDHSGLVPVGRMSTYADGGRKLNKTTWFSWPEQKQKLADFCWAHSEEDVYFSPQLYSKEERKKENVVAAPVLWADADTAAPEVFNLDASIIVESSPGKYQLYWHVDEGTPEYMESASKRIAYAHREEGCDTGWALTKYLRVPFTTNTKYHKKFQVQYKLTGAVHTEADFLDTYGDPAIPTENEREWEFPTELPDVDIALESVTGRLSVQMADLITKVPESDWSTALWTLECSLARAQVEKDIAFVIVRHSQCNKYRRDGRSEEDLWQELCRAYETVESEQMTINLPESVEQKPRLTVSFLSKEEHDVVLNNTFINRYVTWASAKTRADKNYHVMSAQAIMSTIFSDFGHAVPMYGNLNLNMWFMLLGQTTNTFKTTARKLMLRVLKKVEDADPDNYLYDLGSDATTEGLLEDLGTRPRRSGIFYRDEAQGLMADAAGGKNYLAGLNTTFTELYDGHVRGRTRAGGKKTKTVPTSMSMYLMGVPDGMAQVLTEDDFKSGFLARMLFYIGTPVERDRLEQNIGESEQQADDIEYNRLVSELLLARRYWEGVTDAGHTVPIVCHTPAWDRFNDHLDYLADVSEGDEIMTAASLRMGMSTLKLACLLAMGDQKKKVSLEHMLTAISYCEIWYKGLQQMSEMVATTIWQGELDNILKYMYTEGRISYAKLYKKFQSLYRPREFAEMVTALIDSGDVIQAVNSSGNKFLEVQT